jgi:hypothetical protein
MLLPLVIAVVALDEPAMVGKELDGPNTPKLRTIQRVRRGQPGSLQTTPCYTYAGCISLPAFFMLLGFPEICYEGVAQIVGLSFLVHLGPEHTHQLLAVRAIAHRASTTAYESG